jgi:NADH dehydrogenase
MMEKILVVGGTGRLGEPVARRLLADGHLVRILSRKPDEARGRFGAEYEVVAGDVEDVPSLDAALQGCRGVHVNLDGGSDPDLERRGAESVSRAALRAGVGRLTYISGASVAAENAWFAGTRAKLDAEAAIRSSGVPCTIFKPTFFMESLPRYVQGARATVIGRQPQRWHWVAAEDYAAMVSRAYDTPEAADRDVFVYGPEAYTMKEALGTYCSMVEPQAKVGGLPFWMAGLIARSAKQEDLRNVLPFLRYTEKACEVGDARETNALLGAPATTLQEWCRLRAT